MNIIIYILLLMILIKFIIDVISSAYFNRSLKATILELSVRFWSIDKKSEKHYTRIYELQKKGLEPKVPIKYIFKCDNRIENFHNMKVYFVNENKSDIIVIYLHGGGYVHTLSPLQLKGLNNIIEQSSAEFVIPFYPLAPFHSYKESYELLTELYKKIIRENSDKKIIFMGESAGGGLALGLAEDLAKQNLQLPDSYILLSPWVELTENNPLLTKYARIDPGLSIGFLKASAKVWADGTDLADYHLSPINGDLSKLNNVNVFVGTREIMYPDNVLLIEKLNKNNVKNKLIIGRGLNHVYPFYPIPEAKKAQQQIIELIKEV